MNYPYQVYRFDADKPKPYYLLKNPVCIARVIKEDVLLYTFYCQIESYSILFWIKLEQ